ncbi:MAG: T9SS type A sorting domain-containing protein [Bacteroidia bacterium]
MKRIKKTAGKTAKTLVASILLGMLAFNTQAQTLCFNPYTNFAVGLQPYSICSADFNNDSFKDLATANYQPSDVSVLLGVGTGNFGTQTPFTDGVTTNPYSVCSADFNGDGKVDLAVANYTSSNVSVLLGTGTSSFGAAAYFTVDTYPFSVISADFNGDGKADLATASYIQNHISILLGTGNGSFFSQTDFAEGTNPYSVISADFNGDGKADLASANSGSNNISVLLNTSTGTGTVTTSFGTGANFAVGGITPQSITSGDFNNDGLKDLATANEASDNITVFLGTGAGNFGTAANFTLATGSNPQSITNGDFNGDGNLDLATANYGTNNISILLGTGTGSFSVAVNFVVGTQPKSVISADFNNDGKTDLATADYGSSKTSVLLNCTATTSIDQFTNNSIETNIYPNPNNGSFVIETNAATKQTVQVYDVNGKIVLSQTINGKSTIDASSLSEGMYNINIISNEGIVNKRLIIVR